MSVSISVDHHNLYYRDGEHELILSVEWSGVAKTADCPIDFEIAVGSLDMWTKPAGEPINPAKREQLLDEIASCYAKGPVADLIGEDGALLRGASTFRFSLQNHPSPSLYYEVGRFLAIPMAATQGAKEWHKKYVADFTGIKEWTDPQSPVDAAHLRLIAERIVRKERIGIMGLPTS
jgi:hypothetical protein